MKSEKDALSGTVAFFYFKHDCRVGTNRTSNGMLRAILAQFLDQDDALLEYMQQKCAPLSKSDVLRESFLKELIKYCLMSQRRAWIILDGLDECDAEYDSEKMESRRIIKWFLEEVLPASPSQDSQVRLLISGQRDGHIDHILSKYPGIDLDTVKSHAQDIEDYAKSRACLIKERFSLGASEEAEIAQKVAATSRGMPNSN